MAVAGEQKIRRPAVAGSFYPADEEDLRKSVNNLLDDETQALTDVLGIVAPHAGYMFSGKVAGTVYGAVRRLQPDVVVLIGPSHMEYFDGVCIYEGDAFLTPLGDVPVDDRLREELEKFGEPIFVGEAGHRSNGGGEHCLEVQLPFLQTLFEGFAIVPIIMGDQKWPYCEALAEALAATLKGRNALLVASSDLSHYHSYEVAQQIDAQFIRLLEHGDPKALATALDRGEVEACGGGPVVSVQFACQKLGAGKIRTLRYQNSGDVWVDKTRVVGYLAAAFQK